MRKSNEVTQPRGDGVSVIVCCFNSSTRIGATLKHLCEQRLPSDISMEVLIVNNASEDDLASVVLNSWKPTREDYTLKIVDQPVRGLANARMKGVEEATFDFAIFCDDDNWLCPTYVATVHSILSRDRMIGIVGGASTPKAEVELPSWFSEYAYAYAVGKQCEVSGDVTDRHYVWGAGMGFYLPFLRKVYEVGVRPILPDRTGGDLSSGNDTEICFWFILAGYHLWYDERLEFKHFIPSARLEKGYLQKVTDGFRKIDPVLRSYKSYLTLTRNYNHRAHRGIKGFVNRLQRYSKAVCVWYLTNRATRTKIKKTKMAMTPFSLDKSSFDSSRN